MNIHIPEKIVNKHRLLTRNEISIYNLQPHIHIHNEPPSGYIDTLFIDQHLGVPCFIDTNANIENANELNEKFVFYVKAPSTIGEPNLYSLYIKYEPEKSHGRRGGKSKKRKTKKSKKNKTNKK